jgi:hypothetical protein
MADAHHQDHQFAALPFVDHAVMAPAADDDELRGMSQPLLRHGWEIAFQPQQAEASHDRRRRYALQIQDLDGDRSPSRITVD